MYAFDINMCAWLKLYLCILILMYAFIMFPFLNIIIRQLGLPY